MSLALDSTQTATVTSTARGFQYLADLDFVGGHLYYTTHTSDIVFNGNTYVGRGDMFDVSVIGESENTADEKVELGLSIANSAIIAAAMGDVSNYRNRPALLYLQFINSTFVPVSSPILIRRYYMDPVRIERQASKDGPSTGRIVLPCRRAGLPRSRHADGLRLSDAQHQAENPGDKFYEYLQTLVDKPTPIVTLPFQKSAQ